MEPNTSGSLQRLTLRDYQQEAVDALFDYLISGKGDAPITGLVTATGKSVVIAEAVRKFVEEYRAQVVVATHVAELVEQDYKAICKFLPASKVGINADKLGRRDTHHPVIVGTIGSMLPVADKLGKRAVFLVDECHRVNHREGTQYSKLISKLRAVNPNMKLWGLTATPYRQGQGLLTDGKDALFDGFSTDRTSGDKFTWFIDQGYIVDLLPQKTLNEIDVSEVKITADDFNEKQLAEVVDNENVTLAALHESYQYIMECNACIVFAVSVNHANHVHDILNRTFGIDSVVITGSMGKQQRKDALTAFTSNSVKVLINVGVLTTGFDYPLVDLMVGLRPTASASLWVQMCGRFIRPVYADGYDLSTQEGRLDAIAASKKGTFARVLDFGGNTARLGALNAIHQPLPKGKRKKSDKQEPPPPKVCPDCQAQLSANTRQCRFCGHEFPLSADLKAQASEAVLIDRGETQQSKDNGVVTSMVRTMALSVHTTKNNDKLLKVTYNTESGNIDSYLGGRKMQHLLLKWWYAVHPDPMLVKLPESVIDIVRAVGVLKRPYAIQYTKNKQYFLVRKYLTEAEYNTLR